MSVNMPIKTDLTGNPSVGTFKIALGQLYDFTEQYLPSDGTKPPASNIANTPYGNITSTDVQAAINELDSGKLGLGGGNLNGAVNETSVTMAANTTLNIGAVAANVVFITGATAITGFDTAQAGTRRELRFAGSLTLTFDATRLVLPSGANIVTQAGDCATFISMGSGNWYCARYQRYNGRALVYDTVTGPTVTVGAAAERPASPVSWQNLHINKSTLVQEMFIQLGWQEQFSYTTRAVSTDYSVGAYVIPATANYYVYQCTTAGHSASTVPSFTTTVGGTTTDGTVTWTNMGAYTTWTASKVYAGGSIIVPTSPNGHMYAAQTYGKSYSSAPTWPVTPGGTVDETAGYWLALNAVYSA